MECPVCGYTIFWKIEDRNRCKNCYTEVKGDMKRVLNTETHKHNPWEKIKRDA